jgi:hypothetical protein
VDTKTKKIIADWKWLIRKQELQEIIDWWDSIGPVDEKFFKSSVIEFDMPESYRRQVIRGYIEVKMPKPFFEGLKKITCYRHNWKNSAGDDCLGFYKDGVIFLNPDEFSSPGGVKSTAIHELGHHVDTMLGYGISNIDLEKKLKKINRKYPGRFTNVRELFATIFKGAFGGGDFEKTFWDGYTDIPNLRPGIFKKRV